MSINTPPAGSETGVATKLQILATEHWSLLATRSLTYSESLARVSVFLAILSGAVIALAVVAQADHFGPAFIAIAILMLLVVLFAGVATVARLMQLNGDDYRWVIGMNRLRNAYLELHPELEPHFVASPYDVLPGALQTWCRRDGRSRAGVGAARVPDVAGHAVSHRRGRRRSDRSAGRARPRRSATRRDADGRGRVRARRDGDGDLGPEVCPSARPKP